ncbi:MAG: AraC family transcriptional regulator [Bacteroidetes bacterium]|nr:AraC family transcriptional regulator [Bacteroidota bacterium]
MGIVFIHALSKPKMAWSVLSVVSKLLLNTAIITPVNELSDYLCFSCSSKEISEMNKKISVVYYDKPIDRVINYIHANLKDDLSLEKLASIANYSPFHFQKLFKEVVGTTPKQFVVLTKLKSATGMMMSDKPKPISVIAYECGFSSPSVFSRSFKNHFNVSAEQLRMMTEQERLKFFTCQTFVKELMHHPVHNSSTLPGPLPINIIVKNVKTLCGFFTNTSLQKRQVLNGFRKSVQLAETGQPGLANFQHAGVIYPHHDLYRSMVIFDSANFKNNENYLEVKPGRYATVQVSGPIEETFKAVSNFYNTWLPGSGYKIADIFILELLADDPIRKPYEQIEREVRIPIEPI